MPTAFSFVGCNDVAYKGDALDGYQGGEVTSQGGFVVEQGDYVYFINGADMERMAKLYASIYKNFDFLMQKNLEVSDFSLPLHQKQI